MDTAKDVKVLALADINTVRGLQWALDRGESSLDFRFKLFQKPFSVSPAEAGDFDLVFIALDLGQPVPVESLKKWKGRAGLCSMIQPTPAQLLSLFDAPDWSGISWDGSNFERLAARMESLAQTHAERIRGRQFIASSLSLIQDHRTKPFLLEWMNPGEKSNAQTRFYLDAKRGFFSIGAQDSRCDLRLPKAGIFDLAELRFQGTSWGLRVFLEDLPFQMKGDKNALQSGDHFQLGPYLFQLRANPKIDEVQSLARTYRQDLRFLTDVLPQSGQVDLIDALKELMSSGLEGELRVSSGFRSGSIFISEGMIRHASTGAVAGSKALLRMFAWEKITWRFNLETEPGSNQNSLLIGLPTLLETHRRWSDEWIKIKAMIPPANLKLRPVVGSFIKRQQWTHDEFLVFAAVSEYHLVRDVLINCPLSDLEVLKNLIQLRQQSLIQVET